MEESLPKPEKNGDGVEGSVKTGSSAAQGAKLRRVK